MKWSPTSLLLLLLTAAALASAEDETVTDVAVTAEPDADWAGEVRRLDFRIDDIYDMLQQWKVGSNKKNKTKQKQKQKTNKNLATDELMILVLVVGRKSSSAGSNAGKRRSTINCFFPCVRNLIRF